MATAWMYGRHSTNKQGATEDVQRAACEAKWRNELAPKGVKMGGWYYDPAVSGGKSFSDRPKGVEIMLLAKKGDYIIVAKLDRAFRSLLDGARTMEMFRQRGVHFVSLDLGFDTSTPNGEFALAVFLAAAQLNRRLTGERTSEVMQSLSAKGVLFGYAKSSVPFGWVRNGTGLAVDQEERDRIEHMAALKESGMSYDRLEQLVNYDQGYRWKRRSGGQWSRKYIRLGLKARHLGYPRCFLRGRRRTGAAVPQPS
jgi:DNA invertase Pin-like site-specific DNA recombinase